jgi:ubiquinone/menaquinone biosynthesis C-methylase UbiE
VSLLPDLNGKCVLDLACGTGRWLQRMVTQGAEPGIGVDLSFAMLAVADRKPVIAGRLAQAECNNLPFRSSTFDFVVCSFALGHILDLLAVVHELARVTKSGSEIFVSDLHPEAYLRGWRTGFRDQREAVQIEVVPRTVEEIAKAFDLGGFRCREMIPLHFGEPERAIFLQGEKSHLFANACRVPAVLFGRFAKSAVP